MGCLLNYWINTGALLLTNSYFLCFYLLSFPVPEPHSQYHNAFSHHISLSSTWMWQLFTLSLFLITLTVVKSVGHVFCIKSPSKWHLSPVFPMITWRFCILERDCRNSVILIIHQGYLLLVWLSLLTLTLISWLRCICQIFLHRVTRPPTLHIVLFGRK